MLHDGICSKLSASQVLPKTSKNMEVAGPHNDIWTCDWLWYSSWEVRDHTTHSINFTSSDFHLHQFLLCCDTNLCATVRHTEWRTKCHIIDCTHNAFLLLQKHLTSGTELILIGWKIVPNEEHVQCNHHFASQPLANEPLHSSQLFDTRLQKARGTSLCGP